MHSAERTLSEQNVRRPLRVSRECTAAGRKDHRHRHAVSAVLIGQHHMPGPDRTASSASARIRSSACAQAARTGAKVQSISTTVRAEMRHQLVELRVADKRAVQHQDLGLAAVFVQHVLEVAEPRLQAHHAVFAQAVDRRVRHLAEVLPEEMAQRAVLVRQHGRRRIVAHRGHRFLAVLGHRGQDLLQLLNRVAGGDLTAAQFVTAKQRLFGHAPELSSSSMTLPTHSPKGWRRPACP